MKTANLVILVLIIFMFQSDLRYGSMLTPTEQTVPADSIIGRWQLISTVQVENSQNVQLNQLEFTSSNTLLFNQKTNNNVELYNVIFYYEYDGAKVKLLGRYSDELHVARNGDYMSINSNGSLIPDGLYRKVGTIPWFFITLALGITTILLLLRLLVIIHGNRSGKGHILNIQKSKSHRLLSILRLLGMITIMGIGAMFGRDLWLALKLLLIPAPWDSIVMLESGLILSVMAIGIFLANQETKRTMKFLQRALLFGLIAVLLGISMFGVAFGAVQVVIFSIFKSYI